MSNPVVDFETLGPDGSALTKFYPRSVRLANARGGTARVASLRPPSFETGIGGAIGTADAIDGPAVVVYVEVDEPAVYVQRALQLGAALVMPVTHVAAAEVTVGWIRDPQVNTIGVMKNDEKCRPRPVRRSLTGRSWWRCGVEWRWVQA